MKQHDTTHLVCFTGDQLLSLQKLVSAATDLSVGDENHLSISNLLDCIDKALYTESGFFLTQYYCEQAYGGPEEGGWWYWTRTPEWSGYYNSYVLLREAIHEALIELDAGRDAFVQIPAGEELQQALDGDNCDIDTVHRGWTIRVHEEGSHSYDAHHLLVIERQPGLNATTTKPEYC